MSMFPVSSFRRCKFIIILGDPGAASRDDTIFDFRASYISEGTFQVIQERKSPWALVLAELVLEVVEFRPSVWPENYFLARQSAGRNSNFSGAGLVGVGA